MTGVRVAVVVRISVAICLGGVVAWGSGNASTAAARGWRRTDLKPVTQPAAIGHRFVLYASSRRQLQLMAVDSSSGKTLWSLPASPSDVTPGVAPTLTVFGGNVIFFGREARDVARVVAVDARSGRVVWQTGLGIFTSWPVVCFDDATAICVTGSLLQKRGSFFRFNGRTGRLLAGSTALRTATGRELGPGLFDTGQRHPELLMATEGSKLAWQRPLKRIFTLGRPSTDWGWNFDRVGRVGLFVGTAGWPPIRQTSDRVVFDLAETMTAGFRIRDGSVVWRSRGTRYVCGLLPCKGTIQNGVSTPNDPRYHGPSVGVRLREVGTISARTTGVGAPKPSPEARVAVEGFDPANGRMRWMFDAGRSPGLISFGSLPPQVGTNTIVIRDRSGRLAALNLADGSHRRVSAVTSGWCNAPIFYKLNVPYQAGGGRRITDYVGDFARFHCAVGGGRRPTPSHVPAFLAAIGARADDLVAWSDTKGLFAAPAGG